MNSSWITDKWWVSHYNFAEEVRKTLQFPKHVLINETTLRDGVGQAGVSVNIEQALRMAELLDELGATQIEVAYLPHIESYFPGTKAGPLEAIAKKNLKAEVWTCVDCARSEAIQIAAECGAKGVYIETQMMKEKLKPYYGWTEDELIERVIASTDLAKQRGLKTSVFLVESTRASQEFLERVLHILERDPHTDRVTLADTFGGASPHGMGLLVQTVKKVLTKPLEVHCHNDFGLALSNAISSVTAGAEIVHSSMNGMGERCGNVSTEEFSVVLLACYGVDTGINYGKIYRVSKEFQKITEFRVSPNKPIVGSRIFVYESFLATRAYLRLERPTVYEPSLVGQRHSIYLTSKPNEYSIRAKLKELGMTVEEGSIQEILKGTLQKSKRKGRSLTDKEFKDIVRSCGSSQSKKI